jgi:hypothetical protein
MPDTPEIIDTLSEQTPVPEPQSAPTSDPLPAPRIVTGPMMSSKWDRRKRRIPPPQGWAAWWPVAAGVALACLAPLLRALVEPYEPWGMRLLFPYVLIAGRHELGMSDELTRTLPQLMLYLQFPLEGLLTKLTLRQTLGVARAIPQLIFLHFVGSIVLFLLANPAP